MCDTRGALVVGGPSCFQSIHSKPFERDEDEWMNSVAKVVGRGVRLAKHNVLTGCFILVSRTWLLYLLQIRLLMNTAPKCHHAAV